MVYKSGLYRCTSVTRFVCFFVAYVKYIIKFYIYLFFGPRKIENRVKNKISHTFEN